MIDKNDLLEWLRAADKKLKKKIVLIAVGGTAMTLLGLKSSTRDVDFCIKSEDKKDFEKALGKKFNVDLFTDGYIFSEQLPEDYAEKSKEILNLNSLSLKALSPVDIVITKAARLNARDEEDIRALSKYVDKEELIRRFESVVNSYSGKEEDYRHHLRVVLKRFF
ncbi:MAG TPA: DUF6036 family nucleotidyltransferase [Candidatus Nanoarchaeia archaeon]|nr:DUF6036 family nucleotidyltransferase [Candidatus Nanoarchaeia archaeon]